MNHAVVYVTPSIRSIFFGLTLILLDMINAIANSHLSRLILEYSNAVPVATVNELRQVRHW